MLARVKKEGGIYKIEAVVTSGNGPQWQTVCEAKTEDRAIQLREYVRYYAAESVITRMIRAYKDGHNVADPTEGHAYWQHIDND